MDEGFETAVAALRDIGAYKRGGLVVTGEHSGDRDEMIGIARTALQKMGLWRPGQPIK